MTKKESEQERLDRFDKQRVAKARRRATESPEQQSARLVADAMRHRLRRQSETDAERSTLFIV